MPNASNGCTPLVAATAMVLYQYNVCRNDRVDELCAQVGQANREDMIAWVESPRWATLMPTFLAWWFQELALQKYRTEAERRVTVNLAEYSECTEHSLSPSWIWKEAGGCPDCIAQLRAEEQERN